VTLNGVGQKGVLVYVDLNHDGKFETNENNKLTASDGSYAFVSLNPSTYTFRVAPPAGEVQTSPANNAGITATLASGGVDKAISFTLAKTSTPAVTTGGSPLTGTITGTIGFLPEPRRHHQQGV